MDVPAYHLWFLVLLNSAVFIMFAFSFTRPRSSRDWRSFGAFAAFIVALFTEIARYARATPAFLPRFRRTTPQTA